MILTINIKILMLFMLDKKKSSEGKCNTVFSSDVEITNNNSNNVSHNTEK